MKHKRTNELTVSDHAIVRYLERVGGLDIDHIKSMIATDELKAVHKKLGNGKFPMKNFTAVIQKNTVVTLIVNK